jgi:hypothetical protein
MRALETFGAPLHDLTLEDMERDDTIFRIGVAPRRIDIMTGVSGLRFADAFARSHQVDIDGMPVCVISREDYIRNKRASGRPKDIADIE